jgi:hypothetical protein
LSKIQDGKRLTEQDPGQQQPPFAELVKPHRSLAAHDVTQAMVDNYLTQVCSFAGGRRGALGLTITIVIGLAGALVLCIMWFLNPQKPAWPLGIALLLIVLGLFCWAAVGSWAQVLSAARAVSGGAFDMSSGPGSSCIVTVGVFLWFTAVPFCVYKAWTLRQNDKRVVAMFAKTEGCRGESCCKQLCTELSVLRGCKAKASRQASSGAVEMGDMVENPAGVDGSAEVDSMDAGAPRRATSDGQWSESVDPASGNSYYTNVATGETTWTPPAQKAL